MERGSHRWVVMRAIEVRADAKWNSQQQKMEIELDFVVDDSEIRIRVPTEMAAALVERLDSDIGGIMEPPED